jgi:outer membrane biosynthesis protein TonB
VNTVVSEQENQLNQQIDAALEKIKELQAKLNELDQLLDSMSGDKAKYDLLSEIHDRMVELDSLGGLEIFWGEQLKPEDPGQHLDYLQRRITIFDKQFGDVQQQRDEVKIEIDRLENEVGLLHQDIEILKEEEESRQFEFIVERDMPDMPFRPAIMPWTKSAEDEKRYRKILATVLLYAILFGLLIPLYNIPQPEDVEEIEIPERLVKLIKKEPPKPVERKKPQPTEQKQAKQDPTKASQEQKEIARKKVERTGLLAFKDNFSDLLDDSPADKLGAKADITNKGQNVTRTERSIVTSSAGQTSGGINTSNISRNVGGSGKSLSNIEFARVESTIGTDMADQQRPLSSGPGPSRTDEEIQIVFDRYKAALYRIYNRELRKNPTLQGKIVLIIRIEPDGSVSLTRVDSIDMGAGSGPLAKKIVARVKRFNFGAKKGVPTVTIKYPIDFLPAS